MSGRRISNKYSSSHSRDTKTQPVKRTIHIVCEGKTELDYFKAIKEKNGFRDYVEIELVDRLNVDRNDTDRLSMIQMATM